MARIVKGILLCIFAILLMSHNTLAFTFNQPVVFKKRAMASTLWWQDNNDGNTWRNGSKTYGPQYSSSGATFFRISNDTRTFDVKIHDIVVLTGTFAATSSLGGTTNTAGMISIGAENLQCPIIDIATDTEEVDNGVATDIYTYRKNFTITCVMAGDNSSYVATNLNINHSGQNLVDHMYIQFKSMYVFERDTSIRDIYNYLESHPDSASDTLQQEKEDVQDASQQSESDSNTAQSDAEGASQSLLNATGSIVSALTSAPATDCNIDISTRHFSIGQVNLCSDVPQGVLNFVHGLIALVFTPIVLYFCYSIVTTLYNLFKEYNS